MQVLRTLKSSRDDWAASNFVFKNYPPPTNGAAGGFPALANSKGIIRKIALLVKPGRHSNSDSKRTDFPPHGLREESTQNGLPIQYDATGSEPEKDIYHESSIGQQYFCGTATLFFVISKIQVAEYPIQHKRDSIEQIMRSKSLIFKRIA